MEQASPQLPLFSADDNLPGHEPEWSVRESARARRLSIKVYPRGTVEVVVPRRTRPAEIQEFVGQHRDWIKTTLTAYAAKRTDEPFELPQQIALPSIEQSFHVRYLPEPEAAQIRTRSAAGVLKLSGSTGSERDCVAALRRWLSSVAKRELGPRLRELSRQTEMPFERLQIRAQRTRWGSRSSNGTISLNLCSLFLTPPQLRYLMLHELCHGKHMNHSRQFWNCVARFEPDCRRLDQELTDSWKQMPSWLGMY